MATTTDPDALPYPEHDKLGPLGTKTSVLDEPGVLRAKILEAFRDAVEDAKQAVNDVTESSPKAVHRARKALRRGRALLMMTADALPKSERRAVRSALQEARRSLSMVRDHAVAPETLGHLDLADDDRETAKRVLDNAAEAIPAVAEIRQLLAEAAARAAAQAEALEAALTPEVSFATVIDGIADVYGEARDARKHAKDARPWFHTWRRRCKELVYQLDFVAAHAGARTLAIRAEIDAVADQLSPAVDLIMLRDFIAAHAAGIEPDAIKHLRATIDDQLDDLMKAGRKSASEAFEQKPKKFGRRLAKAVKRDLTPVDANGHDPDGDRDA